MSRILLIDDDERLAEPLAAYFARYDLSLTAATHPQAGLDILAREDFDLVILDVMLPDQDGFAVCRELRQHRCCVSLIWRSTWIASVSRSPARSLN
jgi:OmpR family response regulator RpaB